MNEPEDGAVREPLKAIIYCRTASETVARSSDVIIAQEARCRAHATGKGYAVVKVVHDCAVSGQSFDRPGSREMFQFLSEVEDASKHVVIVDDVSRLGRSMTAYLHFRDEISAAGVKLEVQGAGTPLKPEVATRTGDRSPVFGPEQTRGPRR